MKHFCLVFTCALLILSCEPQEEQVSPSQELKLTFSEDTVIFDTLLTIRASMTKRFRIFNPNKKAIEISSIRLGKGTASPYQVIINGRTANELKNEVIFGGDSIMVLVQVDIDPQDENLPYLVKDSVIVAWNQNSDHVKLVAWGQDANYINARTICNETWTADRPYVIYNYAFVDPDCQLNIAPGTKVYLDNGASLFVQGTLTIQGDSASRVTIRNTRFDANYREAPGQWGGLIFLESSHSNQISYADIENGDIGIGIGYSIYEADGLLYVLPESSPETVDIRIDHTSIRHMSNAGIIAFSSDVYAYNTEVYNVGSYLVGNFAGGNYRYEHCTFANQPAFFINEEPVVQISDNLQLPGEEDLRTGDLNITIRNSIIWGTNDHELLISKGGGANVVAQIESNLLKMPANFESEFFSSEHNFLSLRDTLPRFEDALSFNYQLDSLSFARDRGIDIGITTDLKGRIRDSKPDIGAFERIDPK